MAKIPRSHILILFLGGSVIDPRGRRGDQVLKASDVEPWMAQMGEMDIIADTEGKFVGAHAGLPGIRDWSSVARLVDANYGAYDGFVIVHDLSTISAAAVVLSDMLENLGKPLILVGSPLQQKGQRRAALPLAAGQEFGAKASIINAVHVAASDIAEVAVVFGSSIFRGPTVLQTTGTAPTMTGFVLGKIDFGIRLFGEQRRRGPRRVRIHPEIDTDVAVIELVPGLEASHISKHAAHHAAVFLAATEGVHVPAPLITALSQELATKPLAIFGQTSPDRSSGAIILTGASRTAALLRFMWALGQSHDRKRIRQLLNRKETA